MGNNGATGQSQNNNEKIASGSQNCDGSDLQQNKIRLEYQQSENSHKYVFQKEIPKKSIEQIKNKPFQLKNHVGQAQASSNLDQKFKLKPTFTQTLFDKEKIKKIANKIIEQQAVISCDFIRCQQQKQNFETAEKIVNFPIFKPMMISQETIFKVKNTKINEKYHLKQIIGEGGFGIVYKAQCLATHEQRAIKVLQLKRHSEFERGLILNEIKLISRLDHPNIIKIYQIFQYNQTYYIVTEYCEGGSLSEYIKTYKPANMEFFAKKVIHKLLEALKYMHSKNIMHRDIKLDNLVFKKIVINGKEEMIIKLIDFGLATEYHHGKLVKNAKVIGTPQYLSPQSINGMHCPQSDVWSCGVVLYYLLQGSYPFKGNTMTEIITKIKKEPLNFRSSQWDEFSKDAKDFLSKLLVKNCQRRLSAGQALSHVWLNQYLKMQRRLLRNNCRKSEQIVLKLSRFERSNNLITYLDNYTLLTKVSEDERERLIAYFNLIDKNHNGVIELDELSDYFKNNSFKLSDLEIKNVFKKLDLNNSSTIYLNQFIYGITDLEKYYEPQHIQQLFCLIDLNKDGYIDKHQLKFILKECNNQEIDFLIDSISKNIKKKINLDQFQNYIKSTHREKSIIFN